MRPMPWCRFLVVMLGLATTACGTAHSSPPNGGKALFTQACGACHTVSGVDSPSHQGGDLLAVHLSRPVLLQFAREMPVRRHLTPEQLQSVADYILGLQRRTG
jgi:mono/diheme cytochrome c family protein